MTLDPTSDLFKRAVEIAGWPENQGALMMLSDETLFYYPDTALALLEHHFRVWLEAKCCDVFICPDCTYQCTQMETGESKAEAPTYIECQMKAIVEIREADRRDLGKRLAEMDSDGTIEGA